MNHFRRYSKLFVLCAALGALMLAAMPVGAQAVPNPLDFCKEGAFSTEEDFVMLETEPFDGQQYVSDGDLLSFAGGGGVGQVCARNKQLTSKFQQPYDIGLDAVDILQFPNAATQTTRYVVAFSTELDHRRNMFSSGDLVFTNGGVIPNAALTFLFNIKQDMGLDAVQFIGDMGAIKKFLTKVAEYTPIKDINAPKKWNNGVLQSFLKRYKIDIWFSIEGTWGRPEGNLILDGDVLSAATGTIVAKQSELLPGIPGGPYPTDPRVRGVDFGLDGLASLRTGETQTDIAKTIYFSTEILKKTAPGFFDGDVMQAGGAIRFVNEQFVNPFVPAYNYLGLDALYLSDELLTPGTAPEGGVLGLPDAPELRGN